MYVSACTCTYRAPQWRTYHTHSLSSPLPHPPFIFTGWTLFLTRLWLFCLTATAALSLFHLCLFGAHFLLRSFPVTKHTRWGGGRERYSLKWTFQNRMNTSGLNEKGWKFVNPALLTTFDGFIGLRICVELQESFSGFTAHLQPLANLYVKILHCLLNAELQCTCTYM